MLCPPRGVSLELAVDKWWVCWCWAPATTAVEDDACDDEEATVDEDADETGDTVDSFILAGIADAVVVVEPVVDEVVQDFSETLGHVGFSSVAGDRRT